MALRTGICVLAVLAAVGLRAEEATAPLENTKQELRTLQKERTPPGTVGSTGKMRDLLPQLQMPASSVDASAMQSPEKARAALEKEKDRRKNWLVDGVNNLEKNSKTKAGRTSGASLSTDDEKPDPGDPDYLLKVFNGQRRETEAKATAPTKVVAIDPLKPFLQGWLANSPVRGKFFDEYVRNSDSGPGGKDALSSPPSQPAGLLGGQDSPAAGSGLPGASELGAQVRAPNPYLQALTPMAFSNSSQASPPAGAPTLNQPAAGLPVTIPAETAPTDVSTGKKQPFWVPSDDKKYFPQLKKF